MVQILVLDERVGKIAAQVLKNKRSVGKGGVQQIDKEKLLEAANKIVWQSAVENVETPQQNYLVG